MILELKEDKLIDLNLTVLLIGEIKEIIVREDMIQADGFIDISQVQSVSCVGLDSYYSTKALGRLAYAKKKV